MASTTPAASRLYEYLHSDYSPDREFVDGEIVERNLGERDHSAWQVALANWFSEHRRDWGVRVFVELRVQVAPTRYRVPDVCLLDRSLPSEQIITRPPLVCIEILSPEDRLPRLKPKLEEYHTMGVRGIWVVDPATQTGFDYRASEFVPATHFTLESSPILLDLPTLIADLD